VYAKSRASLSLTLRTALLASAYRIAHGWHELEPVEADDQPQDKSDSSFERWLRNVGTGYAHDQRVFAEEVARFGIDGVQAEAFRRQLLEDEAA
jgi:hypothetical protein